MFSRFSGILTACFLFLFFWGYIPGVSALSITATVYPLYDVARYVAPQARIHLLVPPGRDVHHFEPGYRDFLQLFQSDLILAVGFEPWLKKHRLLQKKTLFLTRGQKLEDPHLWLDLPRLEDFIHRMVHKLEVLDPKGAPSYRKRAQNLISLLEEIRRELKGLSRCPRRRVVILGHAALTYLLREAGLKPISLAGVHPESEVVPGRLRSVLLLVERRRIPVVFLLDPEFRKYALLFQRQAGVRVLTLNPGIPLCPEDRNLSFPELLRKDIKHLREGLCARN